MADRYTHSIYVPVNEGYPPLNHASGVWVWDAAGVKRLDFMSGYSANNFGHLHPHIVAAAKRQLDHLTLTSRAYEHNRLEAFSKAVCELAGKERIIPMNSGAEAVETAIKLARKWGVQMKGVDPEKSNIIVMGNNFHGRTTTIVSFSSDPTARRGFGPFTPGFRSAQFGSIESIASQIDENTVAVLFEPIQGEAGVIIPPDGFLSMLRGLCSATNVLMIADEIQSGLGRTGYTFACDYEDVEPDVYILGKALGGGIMPVSAVVANADVMDAVGPGEHGSTFGGNPLACAVGIAAVELLETGDVQAHVRSLEHLFRHELNRLVGNGAVGYRQRGLWAGIDIDPAIMTGHEAAVRMYNEGVLAKETHGQTIRFSPPLIITRDELRLGVRTLANVLYGASDNSWN